MSNRRNRPRNRGRNLNRPENNQGLVEKIKGMSTTQKIIGSAAIVGVLAAGTAGVVWGMYSNNNDVDSTYSSGIEDPIEIGDGNLTFQDVLEKRVLPEEYLNHLSSTMPEILEAKKDGYLQGIYFNPSDKELETIALQHFANVDLPIDGMFKLFLDIIIDDANTERTKKIGRITNSKEGFSGKANYSFMLVWPKAFEKGNIVKDEDFRLALRHELLHAQDEFNGISYDGVLVDTDKLSNKFLGNLREIRATAFEIEYILNHPNENSKEYTANRLNLFAKWRDNLCPTNQYEVEIKKKQLAEFPITVERSGNTLKASLINSENSVEAKYVKHKIPNYCLK